MQEVPKDGLYIALFSIHGLIRGTDLELGRDADTGGQTKYVLELAAALGKQENVARVELITRLIDDDSVSEDYAQPVEFISDKVSIVRLESGPAKYLPKESLWDHLDGFTDNAMTWFTNQSRMPDVLHSHYADAGYVATRLHHITGISLVHTGHSLGRDKRKRLMASGMTSAQLEAKYHFSRRIEAEEDVLANADLVITSTNQEITDQYEPYDFYKPETMTVIPPGTQLEDFHPPELGTSTPQLAKTIRRFLDEPDKPMILALSRPDPRKNIATLLKAYGENRDLQDLANLVIVAGNREDIRKMDEGAQSVLTELLVLIDYYNLYGKVALPKRHLPKEVPEAYRMAAISRGVFVNPALTEPFGLTLLEAAACGLPFVATENGGPVDIVKNCHCGLLVDPLNPSEMGEAIRSFLLDGKTWKKHSQNGLKNVALEYSWDKHAKQYLKAILPITQTAERVPKSAAIKKASRYVDRMIISDLDKTLLSNTQGLKAFTDMLQANRKQCAFGIATARRLDSVLAVLKKYQIPTPDILICSLGTEIYYGKALNLSTDWSNHVDHNWNPKAIKRILSEVDGLVLQSDENQSRFKISYEIQPKHNDINHDSLISILRKEEQAVNAFVSANQQVDITPSRASKGLALRYVAHIWNIPIENILVSGGSGTDEDMMYGNIRAVVVSNRQHEALSDNTDSNAIFYAKEANALGILEAVNHYDFFPEQSLS